MSYENDELPPPAYVNRIDLRFWLRVVAYSAVALLIFMGLAIATAVTFMALRFINREPGPRPVITTTTVNVPETTFRTLPPTVPTTETNQSTTSRPGG